VTSSCESSLTLTALTLRGVGSYVYGARLNIRPLTILCGVNGSGKSTWLKALDLLKESHAQKILPFGFVGEPIPTDDTYTNALIAQAAESG
jgi:predicted ATPase